MQLLFLLLFEPGQLEEEAEDGLEVALANVPGLDVSHSHTHVDEELEAGLDVSLHDGRVSLGLSVDIGDLGPCHSLDDISQNEAVDQLGLKVFDLGATFQFVQVA